MKSFGFYFLFIILGLSFFSCSHQSKPEFDNDNSNGSVEEGIQPAQKTGKNITDFVGNCFVVYEQTIFYNEVDESGNTTRQSIVDPIAEGTVYYYIKNNSLCTKWYGSMDTPSYSVIKEDNNDVIYFYEKVYSYSDHSYSISYSERWDTDIILYRESKLVYGGTDGEYIYINKYLPDFFLTEEDEFGNIVDGGKILAVSESQWLLSETYKCKIINTYNITFDASGGTIENNTVLGLKNIDFSLPTASGMGVSKEGYIFKGWATAEGSKEIVYEDGGNFTGQTDVTLYAVWGYNVNYTITYNANGGTIENGSHVYSGETIYGNISATLIKQNDLIINREGYFFKGWATTNNASSVEITDGQTITITGDLVLYAVWSYIATYTISFNANEGNITTNSQTITGETITGNVTGTLSRSTVIKLSRSGYKFKGWGLTADTREPDYLDASKIIINSDIEIFAIWDLKVSYTITFNPNGGTLSENKKTQIAEGTQDEGATVTLTSIDDMNLYFSYSGGGRYLFTTWCNESDQSLYDDCASITIYGDTTLRANWYLPEYTIRYYDRNSLLQTSTVKGYYAPITVRSITSRAGYTFVGWKCGDYWHSSGETVYVINNITFDADWEENCFYFRVYHPGYPSNTGEKFSAIAIYMDDKLTTYQIGITNSSYYSAYQKYSDYGSISWDTGFDYRVGNSASSINHSGTSTFSRERYYTINVADGTVTCDR